MSQFIPAPAWRKPLHHRHIATSGFARSDGLFDIEGQLQDISPDGTDLLFRTVPAGTSIHDLRIVLTVDRELVIRGARARIESGPTIYCPEIEPAYAALSGMRIGPGFKREVKARLGGVQGCTHLTELVSVLATTAMQTIFALLRTERGNRRPADEQGPMPKPTLVNSCHTHRIDGEAVKVLWPEHRRAAAR
ncbi:DUF2889 domain-containing protein [Cupriavidus sp. DF5525]|uniref:DUF2889 domain-containing protein n=1 Tax=Cupriavidus sp. DF5525 TaxID=3160989 RepID=UPI0032DE7182